MKIDFNFDNKLRQFSVFGLIMICFGFDAFAQTISKPTRQSSIEAFSDGRYEIAYNQFSELLLLYPKDPLYKYYSGVSLVNLKRNPGKATSLLEDAIQSSGVLKSLPSDALFFLGRAQQMSGKFTDAIGSYRKFGDLAGRKTAREYGISDYIKQCTEKTGSIKMDDEVEEAKVTGHDITIEKVNEPDTIYSVTVKNQPLPQDYEKKLDEALKLQFVADSLMAFSSVNNNVVAESYQKEADIKFNEADILKKDSIPEVNVPTENTQIEEEVRIKELPNQDIGITEHEKPEIVKEIFSVFEVTDIPVTDKIAIDPEVPEGLIYRIQMAVFRNPVDQSYFKGIMPVHGFRVPGKDLTIYYAGMFRRSSDASKALLAVKSKGFKDSFVVSFSGTKPVSADRAVSMERDWGIIPLFRETEISKKPEQDTVPLTLSFRVEVMRSEKPLKDDILEGIKKVEGNRGMDIITDDKGKFVYLIGKFITFESAAEYSDLLIRNGYREAKVTAWLGKNEIPLETAKQLFEKLE